MRPAYWLGGLVAALAVAFGIVYIGAGGYDVAADVPHWPLTHSVMENVRTRSIARHSGGIEAPALDDEALVTSGAGNYDAMCAGCHLKPGVGSTEMSRGLYPAPPSLADKPPEDPAAAFWVIKHGIKMTGMPAWGKSMEDKYVWGLVAFLNELPGMSAERYRELVEASGGHQHGAGESDARDHADNQAGDDHLKAPPHQH